MVRLVESSHKTASTINTCPLVQELLDSALTSGYLSKFRPVQLVTMSRKPDKTPWDAKVMRAGSCCFGCGLDTWRDPPGK